MSRVSFAFRRVARPLRPFQAKSEGRVSGEILFVFRRLNRPVGSPGWSKCEFVKGGLTIDDNEEICRRLVAGGVDMLHASTGRGPEAFDKVMEPMSAPEGWRLPYARRLREATGVPVIGVGQIRLPETGEQALMRSQWMQRQKWRQRQKSTWARALEERRRVVRWK